MKRRSFTNLLFRISGSEHVSNCQSHVISVNEALLRHMCFEISIVHVTLAVWYTLRTTESKQKICKASTLREAVFWNRPSLDIVEISKYLDIVESLFCFLFFWRTKYSRRFIILRLNHCTHMNCFKYVFSSFLGIESDLAGNAGLA